jgi:MYXO-CTERM domain-containing protein
VDADGDGHADMTGITTTSSSLDCSDEGVAGVGAPVDDCDDTDATVHPGATEGIADGTDQDCDGTELCYMDADSDGARSSDGATVSSDDVECDGAGEAGGAASVDCDDADGSVHPAATETPADGIDSNCDGAELCFTDYDGDGYRPDEYTEVPGDLLCTGEGMVGASAPGGDCDDSDASINPDGEEVPADGIDSDCDGMEQCYLDADGDGYRPTDGGLAVSAALDCDGDGVTNSDAPATDCDDDNASAHPDALETVGDEIDLDCDGRELCYADLDDDGYRTADVIASLDADCSDPGEATEADMLIDCDDTRAGVNPDAEEIPGDGIDQDCDGTDPSDEDDPEDDPDSTPDADTGSDATPVDVTVTVEDSDGDKSGCGCASGVAPARLAWTLPLLGLIGLRRRRMSA